MRTARICVGAYHLKPFQDWVSYQSHLSAYVEAASAHKANILLLPEYSGLEMNPGQNLSLEDQFENVNHWHDDYIDLCENLAKKHTIHLLPGTVVYKVRDKKWRNRAYFFYPNGQHTYQDKIYLTKFEHQTDLLERGDRLKIIETAFGKVGIAVCYDVEFPGLVSRFVAAGVKLILVPSCTETLQGFYRVHISSRARAIENQIFVANACTVLNSPWSSMVDVSIGRAGVFSPADGRFPEDGILQLGELNQHEQYTVDLNFEDLEDCRENGAMANFHDSQEIFPEWVES